MAKNNHRPDFNKKKRTLVHERAYVKTVIPFPEELKELLQSVKGIDSQNRVIVTRLHNLHVELARQNEHLKQLVAVMLECLSDPASQSEIDKVLQDFINTKRKLEK